MAPFPTKEGRGPASLVPRADGPLTHKDPFSAVALSPGHNHITVVSRMEEESERVFFFGETWGKTNPGSAHVSGTVGGSACLCVGCATEGVWHRTPCKGKMLPPATRVGPLHFAGGEAEAQTTWGLPPVTAGQQQGGASSGRCAGACAELAPSPGGT